MNNYLVNEALQSLIQRQNEIIKQLNKPFIMQTTAFSTLQKQNEKLSLLLNSPTAVALENFRKQQVQFSKMCASSFSVSACIDFSAMNFDFTSKCMAAVHAPLFSASSLALKQYTNSLKPFASRIDWTSFHNISLKTLSDLNINDDILNSWNNSVSYIADSMVQTEWVSEDEKPDTGGASFPQKPLHERFLIIVSILAALCTITGFNIQDLFNTISDAINEITPKHELRRELNEKETEIITCQTELLESVSSRLLIVSSDKPSSIE